MKFNSIFKTMFYGLCLGISLLPPGFSVATMAMILGIYEELINLLNDLFSPKMKQTLKILSGLAVGAIVAIRLFASLISSSMDHFPYQTRFFFLGLIAATIPLIFKQADVKSNFKLKHFSFLIIAIMIVVSFVFTDQLALVDLGSGMTIAKTFFLMLAGALVSASMILPGLSGALMLMLLGVYQFLLDSVRTLDLMVLGIVAVGGVVGLVICGRLIKHLLANSEATLYAISLGLVIGSIPVVLSDGIPNSIMTIMTSIVCALIGFIVVLVLNWKKT